MTQSLATKENISWNPFIISSSVSPTSFTGNWTLSSMSDEEETLYMNAEFIYNFDDNNNFSVTKIYGEQIIVSHGKALIDINNNMISLLLDGETLNFEISKITSSELVLKHNSGLTYYFLKNQ